MGLSRIGAGRRPPVSSILLLTTAISVNSLPSSRSSSNHTLAATAPQGTSMDATLGAPNISVEVLPGLGLLRHDVRVLAADPTSLLDAPQADIILVDGTVELSTSRALCRLLQTTGCQSPIIVVLAEGGLVAVSADWGVTDVILQSAGPAEVDARIRLALGKIAQADAQLPSEIRNGDLVIDEAAYSAKINGRVLDLTYKEFELLRYLAQHPGRVFTRIQLLQEVWGYDYFGGTRTVDVHVRRLRSKLGVENEALIGTVRNVGYRFVASGTECSGGSGSANAVADSETSNDQIGQRRNEVEPKKGVELNL